MEEFDADCSCQLPQVVLACVHDFNLELLVPLLGDDEHTRALRFRQPGGYQRFILAHTLKRCLLAYGRGLGVDWAAIIPSSGRLGDSVEHFLARPYWLRTQRLSDAGMLSISLAGDSSPVSLLFYKMRHGALSRHLC